jgi:hypothetical protein
MTLPNKIVIALVCGLGACSPGEPTILGTPPAAIDVGNVVFLQGRAHQTDFTLEVGFPANPAFDYYSNVLEPPWERCDWSGPGWEDFGDITSGSARTIHQQLHMWVNREARRRVALATRYYSPGRCAGEPSNNKQKVVVVEYLNVDVDETISTLKLTCPAAPIHPETAASPTQRSTPCAKQAAGGSGEAPNR